MKKLLLLFSAALTMLFVGCSQFDDSRIWDAIDELEDLFKDLDDRVEELEEACEKMNTNIEALQTLVTALQNHDTITSIAPIKQGDKIIGYTISFSKSEPITIYHGTDGKDGADGEDGKDGADGKDGYTPTIGVAQDEDGAYYWTLDGEWLLDENGNKIKAVGTDGKDGEDGEDGANGNDGSNGENGENGADGKDGITPQLEIRDGYWYISYDNGATWKELGKATGEDGKDGANGADGADGEDGKDGENGKDGADGDSLFQSVTWDEEYAYFTLADGTVITIPLSDGAVTKTVEITAVALFGDEDHGMLSFGLSDVGFNIEGAYDGGVFLPNSRNHILTLTVDIDDYSVVPQGTFTSEAGDFETRDGCWYLFLGQDGSEESLNIRDAVVIVSEGRIEATLTLQNGEVHHVVYEGSLKLYEEGEEEEDTTTPPANEIWYTSTDGEVVTPYNADAFGVNIISNTYENGVGIITFDGDVTEIGLEAFRECSSLASVTIPDSVTSIGESAFVYCSSLASVSIGNGVTSIGEGAFAVCLSLASVTIPDSVTEIGNRAFKACSSLASVSIGNGVTSIGKEAFAGCESLVSATIPDSVTWIGDYAFLNCFSLTSITIPDSVTSIGEGAFAGCESLVSIVIPDSVTSIGRMAFNYCLSLAEFRGKFASEDGRCLIVDGVLNSFAPAGLNEYTIPDSVTSIGRMAFNYCLSLASVTIPDSVTEIEDYAFNDCYSLTYVYCKATTPPIMGYDPFYYTLANIYVPEGCVEAYKSADGWSQYAYAIKEYAPVNYASWLGSYTISGIGSVYDSEADSRVEKEVEFTITVEAKDESSLSYNVTGWDGCPYPITAYYGSEDELILSAGMVVEGLDLGDGTYSDMGDLYCVGVLEGNQILIGGPIIKLSKDANQVVGITTNGNEVIGITFCFQAYEDGVFYLLKRYGLLYTPMDMAMSSGASYAPKKAVAFGGRNSGIDRTRTLRVVK